MSDADAELQRVLRQLKQQYLDEGPARLADLRAALDRARGGDPGGLAELRQLFHRLAGSGGSYGLDTVTEEARAGEQAAFELGRQGAPPSREALDGLAERILGVERAFRDAT